jgi:hypothetical protein
MQIPYILPFYNIDSSIFVGGLGSHRNWLSGLDSPLIKDEGGQVRFSRQKVRSRFLNSPNVVHVAYF